MTINKCFLFVIWITYLSVVCSKIQEISDSEFQNLSKRSQIEAKESLICNRTFTEKELEILSPGYGVGYPNNLRCSWFINVKPNNSISLEFHDFHLEGHRDFLTIYDGNSSSGIVLGNYTGDDLPPVLVSSTNNLFLNFITDNVFNKTGFNITYRTIKFGCGGQLDEFDNAVFSPGYPDQYPDNVTCIWNITVSQNKYIILNIEDIDIETHDMLSVYDQVEFNPSYGRIPLSESCLAHFSNRKGYGQRYDRFEPKTLTSKRNQVFLEFKSNEKITGKGFEVYYHTKDMGMKSRILISVPNAIIKILDHDYPLQHVYYQGLKTAELIDYDSDHLNLLYFRPETNEIVLKNEIPIHDDIHFSPKTLVKTHGMTIDWVHSLLFWIDIRWRAIKVFHMSQKHDQNVYTVCNISTPGDPRELIFNREERVLVWTIIGEPFFRNIMYANPDGTNQMVLHFATDKQPFHLTIDYEKQNYYFIDITKYSLHSIDFKGRNEKFYLRSKTLFQSINTMLVMERDLYLSTEHTIYRIPEFESKVKTAELLFETNDNLNQTYNLYKFNAMKVNAEKIFGFRLQYSHSYFSKEKNYCKKSNCSHLCLPTADSYRCVCPSDYKLENNTICMKPSKQIPHRKAERYSDKYTHSDKHPIINSLLIAFLFVIILLFYVGTKLSRLRETKNCEPDKTKRTRLRLIMKDEQDGTLRYEDDL